MGGTRFAFEFGWRTYFKFTVEVGSLEVPQAPQHPQVERATTSINDKSSAVHNVTESISTPRHATSHSTIGQSEWPTPSLGSDTGTASIPNSLLHSPSKPEPIPLEPDSSKEGCNLDGCYDDLRLKTFDDYLEHYESMERHKESKSRAELAEENQKKAEASIQHSPLFRLPLEVRQTIYSMLLVSTTEIEDPAGLLDDVDSLMLSERVSHPDMDATITRTCRTIHEETLDILYGCNMFVFDDPDKMHKFGDFNMARKSYSIQTLHSNLPGTMTSLNRITLLRHVTIRFKFDSTWRRHNRLRDRDGCWRKWKGFFQSDFNFLNIKFRSLQKLVLDFSAWELTADEGLVVQPLISKFEEATCLKKITVMGVKHEQTLGKLRSGLAQGGRTFIAGHTQ